MALGEKGGDTESVYSQPREPEFRTDSVPKGRTVLIGSDIEGVGKRCLKKDLAHGNKNTSKSCPKMAIRWSFPDIFSRGKVVKMDKNKYDKLKEMQTLKEVKNIVSPPECKHLWILSPDMKFWYCQRCRKIEVFDLKPE